MKHNWVFDGHDDYGNPQHYCKRCKKYRTGYKFNYDDCTYKKESK